MLAALLPVALDLIAAAAPSLSTSALVGKAIQVLSVAVPAAIQTSKDLAPVLKIAIEALRSNKRVTPAQLAELDALEAKIDADYDAASAAAKAEDEAPSR